jgi:aminoglycoside 3-N-acetyltransferase
MSDLPTRLRSFVQQFAPTPVLDGLRAARSRIRRLRRNLRSEITRAQLVADLRAGGICEGDTLMVHCSLKSIGNVQGGAATVVQALMETVTDRGNLLLPAFTNAAEVIERSQRGDPVDLRTEPSKTGKVTEFFRTWPGVRRSSHPFESVCAWGKDAAYVIAGHESEPKICHGNSPFARLVELQGKVVGLGISLGPVTFYHFVEDTWEGFPLDNYLPEVSVTYVDERGKSVTRGVKRYDPLRTTTRIDMPSAVWLRGFMTQHLDEKGLRRRFGFGDATAWVISADAFYDEIVELAKSGLTIYTTQSQWESRASSAQ